MCVTLPKLLPSPTDSRSDAHAGTRVSVNRDKSALYALPELPPNHTNRSSAAKLNTSPTSSITGPNVTAPDPASTPAIRSPLLVAKASIPP